MADYVPIACMDHERLEFAVLKRQRLHLVWREDEEDATAEVIPTDVYTRDAAEWLEFRSVDGHTRRLRLDRIISIRLL
jgi:Rho-binding antiterminator